MNNVREISKDFYWVGGNDRRLEMFENLFPLKNGVSYNSYLIKDEKTVLIDSVDDVISDIYLENIRYVLDGRDLDYLVINHMEPDHCGSIVDILRVYPNVKLVGNKKTFQFFNQFYSKDIEDNKYEVKEGDVLELGNHSLEFIFTPMVHWPEVMMNFEKTTGTLFSADAFGTFGVVTGNIFDDETDYKNLYFDEARRYYSNIVGKFGVQVQGVFRKLKAKEFNIKQICSLHGPILRGNIEEMLDVYDKWSKYEPEKDGVVIFYGSMYGNTENTVHALANKLAEKGIKDIRSYDVSKTHPSYVISDIWKYSHIVAAAPTYNMGLYYPMDNLLNEITALGVKNRKVAIIGNHSWASAASRIMEEKFTSMKNMEILENMDIKTRLKNGDGSEEKLDELAETIANSILNK